MSSLAMNAVLERHGARQAHTEGGNHSPQCSRQQCGGCKVGEDQGRSALEVRDLREEQGGAGGQGKSRCSPAPRKQQKPP